MTEKTDRMISKKISKIIENELSWTNGWYVEEKRYKELCISATRKILKAIQKLNEVGK